MTTIYGFQGPENVEFLSFVPLSNGTEVSSLPWISPVMNSVIEISSRFYFSPFLGFTPISIEDFVRKRIIPSPRSQADIFCRAGNFVFRICRSITLVKISKEFISPLHTPDQKHRSHSNFSLKDICLAPPSTGTLICSSLFSTIINRHTVFRNLFSAPLNRHNDL